MNTSRFGRYVEQFGLECIERNHRERLMLFARIWIVVFALFGVATVAAIATNVYPRAWLVVDSAALSLFAMCSWQRYKMHKQIKIHRELAKSPA